MPSLPKYLDQQQQRQDEINEELKKHINVELKHRTGDIGCDAG